MSDQRSHVLFLCTGNSCRSQMAEGWLRELAQGRCRTSSAGTRPKGIHPGAIAAMAAAGVDLSTQSSDSIDAYLDPVPDVVIAVCDHAAEHCPELPGAHVVRWPFRDPDGATGTPEEIEAVFHEVRDAIRARLAAWVDAWPTSLPTPTELLRAAEATTSA